MNKIFKSEVKKAKAYSYKETVADLKTKSPGQWYSHLMTKKGEKINIDEISHLLDQSEEESIADKFTEISNEYPALKTENNDIPISHQKSLSLNLQGNGSSYHS